MAEELRHAGERDGKALAVNVISLPEMSAQKQALYVSFAREIARDQVGFQAATLRSAGVSEAAIGIYRASAMQAFDQLVGEELSRAPARFAS